MLSGDRNLAKSDGVPGIALRLVQGEMVRWSDEMHQSRGNLLFADGHVVGSGSADLGRTLHRSLNTATGVVGTVWMPTAAPKSGTSRQRRFYVDPAVHQPAGTLDRRIFDRLSA